MAEIGFIASVITLAGVGHSIAISLYDFASAIGSAAGDVKSGVTRDHLHAAPHSHNTYMT
jgi:FlaG/FlaF family flagellin (archaellin)